MKLTTETTRFLNHLARREKLQDIAHRREKALADLVINTEHTARIEAETERDRLYGQVSAMTAEIAQISARLDGMIEATRALLPKIRADIYTDGAAMSPRWFSTGKWWPRETGGIDGDLTADLSVEELTEAIGYYANPGTILMLPRSKRDQEVINNG